MTKKELYIEQFMKDRSDFRFWTYNPETGIPFICDYTSVISVLNKNKYTIIRYKLHNGFNYSFSVVDDNGYVVKFMGKYIHSQLTINNNYIFCYESGYFYIFNRNTLQFIRKHVCDWITSIDNGYLCYGKDNMELYSNNIKLIFAHCSVADISASLKEKFTNEAKQLMMIPKPIAYIIGRLTI